jgi:FKBP-type peptidyl-prolyl cis-trans isomerase FklB
MEISAMNKTLIHGITFTALFSLGFTQAHAQDSNTTTAGAAAGAQSVQTAVDPAEKNKQTGAKFMEDNKAKSGVVTLPSGLQYSVIEAGKGKKPTASDMVTVDYEGKLLNDQVFDSSYKRGQPASFPVNGVIAGWQEALQLMNEGSTWMLYIPPNLAYGEAGAGPAIGPNETLVFKVHLIKVQ